MKNILRSATILFLALIATGCATTRGVMEVVTAETSNPDSGTAVRIASVVDSRTFQIAPPRPDIPSLKGGEIHDPAITSRAIARKRNTFGKALGDILLPEGQTVMDLVATSVTNGLREGGYRVLSESDPGYAEAVPLDVDIQRFWGWFQPGFWQLKLHYVARISVRGPVKPFTHGVIFESNVERGYQVASEGNWRETIDANLDELNRKIVGAVRR